MRETSCLSKRDGKLICHAKDPISSGLAIDGFLGPRYFERTRADVFCIGAGGSGIAITWQLMRRERGENVPARIVVSDRSQARLDELKRIHREVPHDCAIEYGLAADTRANDNVLRSLKPGSLIINATGLGKDAPGSPLTDCRKLPRARHRLGAELSR